MSDLKDTQETKSSRLQIWGAAIILLMIVLMLIPTNLSNRLGHQAHGIQIGTASNGRKIMSQDRLFASNLLDALQQIYVYAGEENLVPLLSACWGEDRVRAFKSNPEALFLLLEEARAISPGPSVQALGELERERQSDQAPGLLNSGLVSVDDLHPMPDSDLGRYRMSVGQSFPVELRVLQQRDNRFAQLSPRSLSEMEQRAVYGAFYDFLTIQSAGSLPLNAVKVSDPIVERTIGSLAQIFTLEAVPFDAAAFISQVAEPTDAQLKAHLDQYAAETAGSVSRTNPFGFGYRVPDRVKFQSLWLTRGDVYRLVEAEKTPYQWEVDARIAFQKNPAAFAAPTSQPSAASATQPAAPSRFEDVRDRAIAATIDAAVEARLGDIERRIGSTMGVDFNNWNAARAAKGTVPNSSLGVPYDSTDYLHRLAADVEARFKVRLDVRDFTDKLYDRQALDATPELAQASVDVPVQTAIKLGLNTLRVSSAAYAIEMAEPLMERSLLERAGELALSLYEPSGKLTSLSDGKVNRVGYLRLTEVDANHPATQIEPIRTQLATDFRRAEAQKLALTKAEAAATELAKGGTPTLDGAKLSTIVAGPFTGQSPIPTGLDMTMPAYMQFGEEIADKLMSDAGPTPAAALNIPLAGRAYAARRTNVAATWPTADALTAMRQRTRVAIRLTMEMPKSAENRYGVVDTFLAGTWLDVADIKSRNGWQPASADEATTQP